MRFKILTLALIAVNAIAWADIDFETNNGIKSIGVYDGWEASPFRNGKLEPNAAITANPDKTIDQRLGYAPNASDKVVAAQRSRFGSNLFGVKIDLTEPIRINPKPQYIHAMIHRPVNGRVALIGLGKRDDRPDQTGEEEQVWTISNQDVVPGKWCDAVFEIKGSADVQLYSIVIVPECESPHKRTEDFLFYVDDITVNDDKKPRHSSDTYPINFNKESTNINHAVRYTTAVGFNSPTFGEQKVEVNQQSTKRLYELNTDNILMAKAGEKICPFISHADDWMHGYLYVDWNNDGDFSAEKELVSYSCYIQPDDTAVNSEGLQLEGTNIDTMPCVTIPEGVQPGVYRMRFILDWSCKDPGGNADAKNLIANNGGSITDIMLAVSTNGSVTISSNQLNGNVADSDGRFLTDIKTQPGKAFKIKMLPAPGFNYSGIRIRSGYNHDKDKMINDNPQYIDHFINKDKFDTNNTYLIPGEWMFGNVFVEGYFEEVK